MSELRTATTEDHEAFGAVLADAFTDDPIEMWLFPDRATRPRLIQGMFGYLARHQYLPLGASVVSPDAVALWEPAGADVGDEFWIEHGEAFSTAVEGQLERLATLGVAMAEYHPKDDCWYLLAIGVRPGAQGGGLGSRLLDHTLEQIDAAHEAAYLEASSRRSRLLYERHGFEVMGEFTVEDSPPLWPMWREPR